MKKQKKRCRSIARIKNNFNQQLFFLDYKIKNIHHFLISNEIQNL